MPTLNPVPKLWWNVFRRLGHCLARQMRWHEGAGASMYAATPGMELRLAVKVDAYTPKNPFRALKHRNEQAELRFGRPPLLLRFFSMVRRHDLVFTIIIDGIEVKLSASLDGGPLPEPE
ncbi:MAG: hypothetical protein LBH65_00975 [Desulfovibrio sp.]|jgi:hypothetical protein|nr:hypothetical protein [Desulfovibrio sp.]